MPSIALAERRHNPRFRSDGLLVGIRVKGRFGRLDGLASDFNRHGLAVYLDQPLPKDKTIFVSLRSGHAELDDIVGIVHNCVAESQGFRCGIQFRTNSALQFDRRLIEQELAILEARFKPPKQARER